MDDGANQASVPHFLVNPTDSNQIYFIQRKIPNKKSMEGKGNQEDGILDAIYVFELKRSNSRKLHKTLPVQIFQTTPTGSHLISAMKNSVGIYDVENARYISFQVPKEISAMAIHPKDPLIAVGDEVGKIFWLYVLFFPFFLGGRGVTYFFLFYLFLYLYLLFWFKNITIYLGRPGNRREKQNINYQTHFF